MILNMYEELPSVCLIGYTYIVSSSLLSHSQLVHSVPVKSCVQAFCHTTISVPIADSTVFSSLLQNAFYDNHMYMYIIMCTLKVSTPKLTPSELNSDYD